jgi:hypothetical protein
MNLEVGWYHLLCFVSSPLTSQYLTFGSSAEHGIASNSLHDQIFSIDLNKKLYAFAFLFLHSVKRK